MTSRTQILYLANAESFHTRKWVEHFSRRGFDITLCSFPGPAFSGQEEGSCTLIPIERTIRLPLKLDYPFYACQVRRIIERVSPAFVHAHYASSYGLVGALSKRCPLIVSVWGSDIITFPHTSPIHAALLRFSLRQADILCATSHFLQRALCKFTTKSAVFTPFGIDCKRFGPSDRLSPLREPALVIGTVKHLERVYGVDTLLRAFALLLSSTSIPLRLVIVGDGSEREPLRSLALSLGIASHVSFERANTHEQVVSYLQSFDIFVTLSRSESFGVVVLEASSVGLPVITSHVGGLPEVVVDGHTGYLIPPDDPESACQAIRKLIDSPNERVRLGANGRQFVLEHYEWEKCAQSMEHVYEDLIDSQQSRLSAS